MDINEVPQDSLEYKDRDKLKKLVYAVGKDGKYTGVGSSGWDPENVATKQAWDAIEEELAETEKQVMDVALLAKYAGKWQWQVRRHMNPSVFNELSEAMLRKYAEVFQITVQELTGFGKNSQK